MSKVGTDGSSPLRLRRSIAMEDLTAGVRNLETLGRNAPIEDEASSGGGRLGILSSAQNAYALSSSPPLIEIQLINVTEEAVADRLYDEAATVLGTDAVTTRLLAGTDTFCDVDDGSSSGEGPAVLPAGQNENIHIHITGGVDPCPLSLRWLRLPYRMTSLVVRITDGPSIPSTLYPGVLRASFPRGLLPSAVFAEPTDEAECDIEYALQVLRGLIEFVRSRRGRPKTFRSSADLQAIPRHIYRTLATGTASGRPLRRSSPVTLQTVMIRPKADQ